MSSSLEELSSRLANEVISSSLTFLCRKESSSNGSSSSLPDLSDLGRALNDDEEDWNALLLDSLRSQRLKCLFWMKKYNAERDQRHILSLEVDELHSKVGESLQELTEISFERQEIESLLLSESQRNGALEVALGIQRENTRRLLYNIRNREEL